MHICTFGFCLTCIYCLKSLFLKKSHGMVVFCFNNYLSNMDQTRKSEKSSASRFTFSNYHCVLLVYLMISSLARIYKILDGVVFSNFHIFLYNMNLQHFEGVVYFNFQILISYITWIYKILEGWYISISMIPYVTCINEIMVELYIDLNFTMGGLHIFFLYTMYNINLQNIIEV